MHASQTAIAIIKKYEGFQWLPYRCPAGYWTVGYGHVLALHEAHLPITHEQAEQLLQQDVRRAERSVNALVTVLLAQPQFDALVSFVFNLGSGAFERSALRRAVNRRAHEDVPAQLMRWVYAGGRKMVGLQRRRAEESMLYAMATS